MSSIRSAPLDSTALLSPDHPLTHTTPTLVSSLRRTAHLSLQKRSRGTSELVKDEEEEVEEGLDPDCKSEDVEDEGPTAGDEDLAPEEEGSGVRVESLGLGGDEAVPEVQQRATPVMKTAIREPLGLVPSIVPSPISSPMIPLAISLPIDSPATTEAERFLTELGTQVEMQGGLIHDHTVRLGEVSPVLFKRYDRDIKELFTWSGAVRDEIFSQRYQLKSLEHEQERVAVTFGVIWRPVLALKAWAGQTDAQRAALWHAFSDTQIENQELRLHITEEGVCS
nr:hypothetical protein [Tanacetum cinerariifolium]